MPTDKPKIIIEKNKFNNIGEDNWITCDGRKHSFEESYGYPGSKYGILIIKEDQVTCTHMTEKTRCEITDNLCPNIKRPPKKSFRETIKALFKL